jgi:AcrR family transcriptional regulator
MEPVDTPASARPRRYRGITAEERTAQRREQLIDAGLELFATVGYADTSVRALSAAASLNSRYFYESFSSREDLLVHVYERVVQEIAVAVIESTAVEETIEGQARSGLWAAWEILSEDPRKARIMAVEVIGVSERLETLRRRDRHAFAEILLRNAFSLADPDLKLRVDPVLNARALIAASVELIVDWVYGELDATVEEVVEYLVMLFTTTTYALARPAPKRARFGGRRGTQGAAEKRPRADAPASGDAEGRDQPAAKGAKGAKGAKSTRRATRSSEAKAPAAKGARRATRPSEAKAPAAKGTRRATRSSEAKAPAAKGARHAPRATKANPPAARPARRGRGATTR